MSNIVRKDVLWCGRWTYPDGRVLNVRPRDLDSAVSNGNAMIQRQLNVPWCWDHQPEVRPVKWQDQAANIAKNVISARTVKFERDGQRVMAAIDVTGLSDREIEAIKRAGKVSARLDRDYIDMRGSGTRYNGLAITHVAVTPTPVEPNQGPFLMGQSDSRETYYLGYGAMADELEDDDKDTDLDDTAGEEVDAPAEVEPEITPEAAAPAPALPAAPAMDPLVTQVVTDLATAGINLTGVQNMITDWPTFASALRLAVGLGAKGNQSTPSGDPAMTATATNAAPGPNQPFMMSQAAMQKAYPVRVENDRADVKARIKKLFRKGKATGPMRDRLVNEFDEFEMSYSGGKLQRSGPLLALKILDDYIPEGTFLKPGEQTNSGTAYDMSGTRPVAAPNQYTDKPLEKITEEIGDDIAAKAARFSKPGAKN